jgi:hypothetical protein
MARKEQRVTITAEGRDKGKTFVLHEMPSDQAERWFVRLVLALASAGAKMPEEILFGGAAGFAEMLPTLRNSLVVALRALQGLDHRDVQELFNEMTPFITWQPPGMPPPPQQEIFPGVNAQIDEVATWLKLRFELIQLHVGFSLTVDESTTESDDRLPEAPTV